MVYTASLAMPVKSALKEKSFQTTISKISEMLVLDPETTQMECVILGPRDVMGPNAAIQKAIDARHPAICLIYVYTKEIEKDLIQCEYKYYAKKIKPSTINDALEEFMPAHILSSKSTEVKSKDHYVEETAKTEIPKDIPYEEKVEEKESASDDVAVALDIPDFDISPSAFEPVKETVEEKKINLEEQIENLTNYKDWNLLREQMSYDALTSRLIEENTEYSGLLQMLAVMDNEIATVWRDPGLTASMKFSKITEIGMKRAELRGRTNAINAGKTLEIIEKVCIAAKRAVEEEVDMATEALAKLEISRAEIESTSNIDGIIVARTELQVKLLELIRNVIDLYKSMNNLVSEEVKDLDAKLPSANEFINKMLEPVDTNIFTPSNTAALATELMKGLQEQRVTMSLLEDKIRAIIDMIFAICEKDNDIIEYQQHMIQLLKANRVEDTVKCDTLLKKVLRLFVAEDNIGRSSTAIIYSGILARRHNTILLDLSGKDKFEEYGCVSVDVDEFMSKRIEKQLLFVRGTVSNYEDLQEILSKVRSLLDYYSYVNIVLPVENLQLITDACDDALTLNIVTNCTTGSLASCKNILEKVRVENVAYKLIMIDPPINPVDVAESINADVTMTKIITIPNMSMVRACALKHDRPYEYSEITRVYEEAFK